LTIRASRQNVNTSNAFRKTQAAAAGAGLFACPLPERTNLLTLGRARQ